LQYVQKSQLVNVVKLNKAEFVTTKYGKVLAGPGMHIIFDTTGNCLDVCSDADLSKYYVPCDDIKPLQKFTELEQKIIPHLAQGYDITAISEKVKSSVNSVQRSVSTIYEKLPIPIDANKKCWFILHAHEIMCVKE